MTTVYGESLTVARVYFNGVIVTRSTREELEARISDILGFDAEVLGSEVIGKKMPTTGSSRHGQVYMFNSNVYLWMITRNGLDSVHGSMPISELEASERFRGIVLVGSQITSANISRVLMSRVHVSEDSVIPLEGDKVTFEKLGLDRFKCDGNLYCVAEQRIQVWRNSRSYIGGSVGHEPADRLPDEICIKDRKFTRIEKEVDKYIDHETREIFIIIPPCSGNNDWVPEIGRLIGYGVRNVGGKFIPVATMPRVASDFLDQHITEMEIEGRLIQLFVLSMGEYKEYIIKLEELNRCATDLI